MSTLTCLSCNCGVRPRQEALSCDLCRKWQHRICNTGITRARYRELVHCNESFAWTCKKCEEEQSQSNISTVLLQEEPMDTMELAEAESVEGESTNAINRTFIIRHSFNSTEQSEGLHRDSEAETNNQDNTAFALSQSFHVPNETQEEYFLNPESVSIHLYCSICQDVFTNPQRAPCGHSFCRKCILPWLNQRSTCPEDRKPVKISQLHRDFILENIIGDQMVACPFRKSGCEFVGQLQRLASHKKSCDFNPENLPSFVKDSSPNIGTAMQDGLHSLSEEDGVVPSPGKPSLLMRLFRSGDSQKKLLTSMFENKENESI